MFQMDNTIFTTGKHKDKTYRDVRINTPEYFMYLVTQCAGNVYQHFGFITYCMEFLALEDEVETAVVETAVVETAEVETAVAVPTENLLYVYTDGACSNNGGPNAKAGLGIYFGKNDPRNVSKKVGGKQTNNVAELSAIIEAHALIAEHMREGKQVELYSDSKYAIGCVTSYGKKMSLSNWKKTIPNKELVRKAYDLYFGEDRVIFKHIKAHTGKTDIHSLGNAGADHLANISIELP